MRVAVLASFLLLGLGSVFAEEPVRVYVLAGQSNMEGKGKVSLAKHQISTEGAAGEELAHLHSDGEWIVRDDVWIKFLGRKGKLMSVIDCCKVVLACRVTPQQKADIVNMIRTAKPSVRTLSRGS